MTPYQFWRFLVALIYLILIFSMGLVWFIEAHCVLKVIFSAVIAATLIAAVKFFGEGRYE